MPVTYTPIASQTLSSSATTVTFSSIPSTYTDLVLVTNAAATTNTFGEIRFNSDTATNYSRTVIYGDGSSAISFIDTTDPNGFNYDFVPASLGNIATFHIMNYANTTTFKTTLARVNNAYSGGATEATVALWRSTSAITTVTLALNSTHSYIAGSTFTLYGIKAA